MSKKTLSFVIGSLSSGGAERVISNLSNELIERFEIIIITFTGTEPFYNLDNRIKIIACYETLEQPTSIIKSFNLNYKLTTRVFEIFKHNRVDIAVGFITSANIITVIAAKLYGIPCIISERNNPLIEEVPRFWRLLRSIFYPLADKIVLQTEGVKKIYDKKIKSSKLIILPNPIASELSNARDDSSIKEQLIITVGRLDKNKSHEDLINAFSTIEQLNWKLQIIGDGDKKDALIGLINDLQLSERVSIISKVKSIEKYYNKASIFVFTSKTEGFPNALLEAMHFGIPSISTDCNFGPSELIQDGVNGYLVPINQVTLLKDKLYRLMCDTELRSKFSKRSKISTIAYESKNVVCQWEELLNLMLK